MPSSQLPPPLLLLLLLPLLLLLTLSANSTDAAARCRQSLSSRSGTISSSAIGNCTVYHWRIHPIAQDAVVLSAVSSLVLLPHSLSIYRLHEDWPGMDALQFIAILSGDSETLAEFWLQGPVEAIFVRNETSSVRPHFVWAFSAMSHAVEILHSSTGHQAALPIEGSDIGDIDLRLQHTWHIPAARTQIVRLLMHRDFVENGPVSVYAGGPLRVANIFHVASLRTQRIAGNVAAISCVGPATVVLTRAGSEAMTYHFSFRYDVFDIGLEWDNNNNNNSSTTAAAPAAAADRQQQLRLRLKPPQESVAFQCTATSECGTRRVLLPDSTSIDDSGITLAISVTGCERVVCEANSTDPQVAWRAASSEFVPQPQEVQHVNISFVTAGGGDDASAVVTVATPGACATWRHRCFLGNATLVAIATEVTAAAAAAACHVTLRSRFRVPLGNSSAVDSPSFSCQLRDGTRAEVQLQLPETTSGGVAAAAATAAAAAAADPSAAAAAAAGAGCTLLLVATVAAVAWLLLLLLRRRQSAPSSDEHVMLTDSVCQRQ